MGNLLAASAASTSFFGVPHEVEEAIEQSQKERAAYLRSQEQQSKAQNQQILREGYKEGHEAAQLLGWLYLGDRFSVRNVDWIKSHDIGFVLHISNVPSSDALNAVMDAASVNYLRLPAEDVETDNIIMIFEQIVNFIENGRNAQQNGDKKFGVLVFCDEGVSRSPTAAIAYLLSRGWTLKSAVKHLNSEWPKTYPNKGFFNQLLEYEKALFKRTSLTEADYPSVFE